MSETKHEFASSGWIDAARVILEELAAEHGEAGTAFSVCEIFTNAPDHIATGGNAAWHFYVDGRQARVGAGEVADADVTIRADYETTLPVARLVYTPEILAERAKEPPAAGSEIQGDMSNMPPYLVELHNRLAVVTA